jgi:hypothetical protein
MDKPFQRKGSQSNTQVGMDFEAKTQEFFKKLGMQLTPKYAVEIGINSRKNHQFDFGNGQKRILVECKAHTWTEGENVPSAKITTWDQAMFFFHVAPRDYRKILFVQKDFSIKRNETLGHYYIRTNYHLIPADVEIWEFDETNKIAEKIN